jgi:O-antigen/teichoic acid export membrane protein
MHLFLGAKSDSTQTAGLLMLAGVPVFMFQYYGLHLLQGLGDIRGFNVLRAATPAVFAAGVAAGLFFGLTVITCTEIWLASYLVVSIAIAAELSIRVRQAELHSPVQEQVPGAREVVRFAGSGFLAQVSPVETFRVDTLVVAGLFSSQIVGYYAVALSISNAPRFIADAIVAVAYPQIAALDAKRGYAVARRYMLGAAVACGGTAAALALASPFVIPLLFGHEFEPAVAVAALLAVAAGLISVRRVGTDCLRALGRPGVTTGVEVVTLAVLAVGFTVLGPWGQGKGVGLALIASAVVGLWLTLLSMRATGDRRSKVLS